MSNEIASLLERLTPDNWRNRVGFSTEMETAQQQLFQSGLSDTEASEVLSKWLQHYQPCLFGRLAAKYGAISYCILSEEELKQSDQAIKDKIQAARISWTREGFEGKKSAFVILAISPLIAYAQPSATVRALAQRLCHLYLETEIKLDTIHLDQIYLEKPGALRTTWKWSTGVNYFCAQADKRWWQDHRIPGGMGFSVNSVGHFVKSGMIGNAMKELEALTGAPVEDFPTVKVDTLDKALDFAMRTIDLASDAASGKATNLLPLPTDRSALAVPECPVKLSKPVADKNHCEYHGWYHTDYTLPSEYFSPEIERPTHLQEHSLDFTYLFHRDLENPDFRLLGEGQQIRTDDTPTAPFPTLQQWISHKSKLLKGNEEEVLLDTQDTLRKALQTSS